MRLNGLVIQRSELQVAARVGTERLREPVLLGPTGKPVVRCLCSHRPSTTTSPHRCALTPLPGILCVCLQLCVFGHHKDIEFLRAMLRHDVRLVHKMYGHWH